MTRRRLRLAVPVLLVGFLLAGCADDPPPSGAGAAKAIAPTETLHARFTDGDITEAMRVIQDHPARLRPHWQALVLLSYRVTGPADHLRWTAAVTGGDGRVFSVESEMGDTGRLLALLEPGDYFLAHVRFGQLAADDVDLYTRHAVSIGDPLPPEPSEGNGP